jgi:ribonuclease G
VRSEETIAIDVERRLRKLVKGSKSEAFLVQVHPRVAAILIGGGGKPLRELEEETGKAFHFHGSEGSPLDTFAITAEGTREEIEARALPFRKGEEVLIRIEEPHMYNVDDAIAKIDGYVISISGGGPFVGEKRLIRIDEVKRTAAYASLLSENGAEERPTAGKPTPPVEAAAPEEPDDGPEEKSDQKVESDGSSGKRRRGRRGGRRRSRAKGSTAGKASTTG